jgi:ribosomal protein S18 acetylase RimI-like enzyme
MRAETLKRIKQYNGIKYIDDERGFLAWQMSTGENIEIVFIETSEQGKGYGTSLIRDMCKQIKPYNSVFVFRLADNETAGHFYRKLGFKEIPVEGLYKCGAVLGVISYEELLKTLW